MQSQLQKIERAYVNYAAKWGEVGNSLPFGTTPDNFGGRHLELSSDGKMALVGTDRGLETSRKETYSIDEILYWIFSSHAYSRGWKYELANRHPTNDSRRIAFSKALEEIGKLNPAWRNRLKKEQEKILRDHPFQDKAS